MSVDLIRNSAEQVTGAGVEQLREKDLLEAGRLMYRSINSVRQENGLPPLTMRLRKPLSLMEHIRAQDPRLNWGYYQRGKLVGFLCSHIRDLQWYIAYFYVDPPYQGRGIGRQLLETGLAEAQGQDMRFLSGCTFSYNHQAIGLFSRCGMYPRKNLLLMKRAAQCNVPLPPRATAITMEPISTSETVADLSRMDCEVRGANRAVDHCYWLADDNYAGYIFRAGRRPAGYAYLNAAGTIGPVLAARDLFLNDILNHCLHEILQKQGGNEISIWVNGKNFGSLRLLLETGFLFSEIAILMTNRVFCDMRRYLPHSTAVF